jgi:hypothetical protein
MKSLMTQYKNSKWPHGATVGTKESRFKKKKKPLQELWVL